MGVERGGRKRVRDQGGAGRRRQVEPIQGAVDRRDRHGQAHGLRQAPVGGRDIGR